MPYGIIGTWRMAFEGAQIALQMLKSGEWAKFALERAVKEVEDYPYYKSVGYGGLPNENCEVELDAAFMDGDTLSIGAVAGIRDYKNPISIALQLSEKSFNSFLVGVGAEEYAHKEGFERKNMLTERAKKIWEKRISDMKEKNLSPYDGHDTVGIIALDERGSMAVGTSTSGLFMKKKGRVGDSPLSGSGFYVDSQVGGASATGLGEEIMKGCLSYEIVRLMQDDRTPQEACDKALYEFHHKLANKKGKQPGAMSVVALNNKGLWGVASNVEFSFVAGTNKEDLKIYLAYPEGSRKTIIKEANKEWLEAYEARIKKPI
jgi:isoaspartyl peptidase/L-asparaginase-like protein (Ntn-hydrolase superfamily)